jgi:hypothetical protein
LYAASALLKSTGLGLHRFTGDNYQGSIPDLLCCLGCIRGIELKQEGEKPSKAQEYQIARINKAGGIAFVAESLDDVKQVLSATLRRG